MGLHFSFYQGYLFELHHPIYLKWLKQTATGFHRWPPGRQRGFRGVLGAGFGTLTTLVEGLPNAVCSMPPLRQVASGPALAQDVGYAARGSEVQMPGNVDNLTELPSCNSTARPRRETLRQRTNERSGLLNRILGVAHPPDQG